MTSQGAGQRAAWLEAKCGALTKEVDALQAKLHDLHSTDLMSLRRAYKSLAQHVQALEHLPALLERAAEPSVTPEWVAGQTRLVAGVSAAVYAVGRLLAAMKVRGAMRSCEQ
ncbi:hypothetical protein HYH02_000812 [Chlamydomonas schloesseri]|uniref:Uncharacterized protein n=1 Tax=Chlamydomonas schloesseri TaxID=2026947 RepID=A0A836BD03_9CHLO|nr:hypothetical protein HYH02_000812 [Chlamydomonas schloesseri]|eukprot:KAG2454987.1 hypothetical protein HYH02_000812 [Chlamydomonas schloesseri]